MIEKPNPEKRGGHRPGAGRPAGTTKYGEPTQAMRVPVSMAPCLQRLLACYTRDARPPSAEVRVPARACSSLELPLYATKVAAGFPSPADDYVEGTLDLNEYLVKRPAATFFVRVTGDSMIGAGIHPGDILIVDRSLEPVDGKIVIAVLDGELTVKRLRRRDGVVYLVAENEHYPLIAISEEMDFMIWGVVTSVIHPV